MRRSLVLDEERRQQRSYNRANKAVIVVYWGPTLIKAGMGGNKRSFLLQLLLGDKEQTRVIIVGKLEKQKAKLKLHWKE